ncbi:MAG: exopolyphosphatase [Deltaproteobacteria bacterium]|mgnify:CR=1 FL=1|jgi:oligoribonuclease NrnB/cAMP/cGMP phosphodiesterase (DHH superfamily)|nr:exopolyphosphatase [Deltaproteobacteria bacterium]MBT4267036.1 exopolyphosphatase [Deltaproteobacteria bacterium]MBT4641919.1 exopolyphosphatase [Deltaproteobacteria bacterium]MBT6505113.1 exopolyphosphatase [Deltaproteobacteria bacterium]MBT6611167.1 exopolyphosphatase [Deltaproteobacteria bacterium]
MRLVTRSDFDGLVCAVLLKEKGIIDEYLFAHPKDIQDGKIAITKTDVLANVPYVEGCGMWFDHHTSEDERLKSRTLQFEGSFRIEKSAAQVIWDYYDGEKGFGDHLLPLIQAVNKTDSGDLTHDEILYPNGWILLSFIMDARSGLGRFKDYRISNHQLMKEMVEYCRTMPPELITTKEDIQERVIRYFDQQEQFVKMMERCSKIKGNIIVSNLLSEEVIYSGNRFVIYAMYPDQNVDVRVMFGKNGQNVVFACGHSILNRSCQTDIGELMLQYGGGGHKVVGTCQVPVDNWQVRLDKIIETLQLNG